MECRFHPEQNIFFRYFRDRPRQQANLAETNRIFRELSKPIPVYSRAAEKLRLYMALILDQVLRLSDLHLLHKNRTILLLINGKVQKYAQLHEACTSRRF